MKKAFVFRLGRVLRARSIAERAARAEWATAEIDAGRAADVVERTRAGIDHARRELIEIQESGGLTASDVLLFDRGVERMWETLRRGRARAAELRTVAEDRRAAWAERRHDERSLERLEERQREAHRTEVQRAENDENDEWASQQFDRRDGGSRRD